MKKLGVFLILSYNTIFSILSKWLFLVGIWNTSETRYVWILGNCILRIWFTHMLQFMSLRLGWNVLCVCSTEGKADWHKLPASTIISYTAWSSRKTYDRRFDRIKEYCWPRKRPQRNGHKSDHGSIKLNILPPTVAQSVLLEKD